MFSLNGAAPSTPLDASFTAGQTTVLNGFPAPRMFAATKLIAPAFSSRGGPDAGDFSFLGGYGR